VSHKSILATWGGARKKAGRKPLREKKRVHRSVTIDPDIYQHLVLDAEGLEAQGLRVKVSDVLNCRLRRNYKDEPNHLTSQDLEEAKRERQQVFKKPTGALQNSGWPNR